MLLLFLMSEICPKNLRVIYVDHQLQAASGAWGKLVQQQCEQLNIPCVIAAVQVSDGNLENQAREARYLAYAEHLQADDVLVLAHHQQDQAETVLLRLFSGAGVTGLSAMRVIDTRQHYQIWRPLLDLSREQIGQWSTQLNIAYINDPSNIDTHYDRAWCRLQLWPVIQQRFAKMQQAISRSSELMQDADQILQEVLQQDWQACGTATQLNLIDLQRLSTARQRQLLSFWMKGDGQYRPALHMVNRLQDEVIAAKSDAQAALHCDGYYYVRYQQRLYRLEKALYLAHQQDVPIPCCTVNFVPDQQFMLASGLFQISTGAMGLAIELLEQNLDLQHRVGGEKIHLYGRVGSWPLKKAIQQAHIFPWLRHTIQILSIDNVMLGVFTPEGFWLAQSEYCVVDGWLPKIISQ